MTLTWFYCAFLFLHLTAYFTVLRYLHRFSQERVIFLYHFTSFALCSLVFLCQLTWAQDHDALLALIFVLATHGIYSVSFLELWSLAEGSYSIQMLMELENPRNAKGAGSLERFTRIGDQKRVGRLEGLQKLRMLREVSQSVSLTGLGWVAASFLSAIALWSNAKNEG